MCDKQEHNFVADARNWEQRVKGEIESARIWDQNWGELYGKGKPKEIEGKIKYLQDEIKKLPVATIKTNSQMSYKHIKPYDEWHDYKRKSLDRRNRLLDEDLEESF